MKTKSNAGTGESNYGYNVTRKVKQNKPRNLSYETEEVGERAMKNAMNSMTQRVMKTRLSNRQDVSVGGRNVSVDVPKVSKDTQNRARDFVKGAVSGVMGMGRSPKPYQKTATSPETPVNNYTSVDERMYGRAYTRSMRKKTK